MNNENIYFQNHVRNSPLISMKVSIKIIKRGSEIISYLSFKPQETQHLILLQTHIPFLEGGTTQKNRPSSESKEEDKQPTPNSNSNSIPRKKKIRWD